MIGHNIKIFTLCETGGTGIYFEICNLVYLSYDIIYRGGYNMSYLFGKKIQQYFYLLFTTSNAMSGDGPYWDFKHPI